MDNVAQTDSIVSLIQGIKQEIILLPEFQRDFVWEIGKTYDLFDSLIRNIFVGSIIYGVPSFEITVREIDTRPRKGKGSRANLQLISYTKQEIEQKSKTGSLRLLLDGQQRITSLYRALKGHDNIWFISKHLDEIGDKSFKQFNLEDILSEFAGEEFNDRLCVKVAHAFEIMESDYFEEEIRENFFDTLKYTQTLDKSGKKTAFRNYLNIVKKLQDLFKSEKLLSYYLLDTTLEKFALFFERSNSRGIQLNFIDILAAKLYHGFNLKQAVENFEEENRKYRPLKKEIIVRSIAFIVSNGKDIDRSGILKNLTSEHFAEFWIPLCQLYKKSLDFLYDNNMVLSHQSWMPYENMLIPLMMFLREIDNDFSQMNEKQNKFIRYWYWASIFAQRYSGASNEVIIQDSLMLSKIGKNEKITDRNYFYKLKSQISSAEDLHSFSKKASAIYKGVLNLINYSAGGLTDWKNTRKLSFNESLDDHHIFPKRYILSNYSKDDESLSLVDSIVNKTLIPKLTNVKIGSKAPSEYLSELKQANPKLENSLEKHLIPSPSDFIKGLYDTDYIDFLKERGESIFQLIETNVTNLSESMRKAFFQKPAIVQNEKIKVFGTYYKKKVYADFYPKTHKMSFQGKEYPSPSSAAREAMKSAHNKFYSVNGWEFWKFIDEQGQEKSIVELKSEDSEDIN